MKKLIITIAVVLMAAITAPAFAAMNPFWDVPASHWAYDAVAQLASRNLLFGYEPGDFRGQNPATRYEIAAMIARSIAFMDVNKANAEDVALMRRLLLEFSDELALLGADFTDLSAKFGAIHEDLGGWKISGAMDFFAAFGTGSSRSFYFDDYKINFTKRWNGMEFSADINNSDDYDSVVGWGDYYVSMMLPYDFSMKIGKFGFNWIDANWNDDFDDGFSGYAFLFGKDLGMANLQLYVGRYNTDLLDDKGDEFVGQDAFQIAGSANFVVGEQVEAGVMVGYEFLDDKEEKFRDGYDPLDSVLTFGAFAKFKFHPSVTLGGIYLHQSAKLDGDNYFETLSYDRSSANAWQALFSIDQDLLQFTSLELKYAQFDSFFFRDAGLEPGNFIAKDFDLGAEKYRRYSARAEQLWGDTPWGSWLEYKHTAAIDDDVDWKLSYYGAGVNYQYNPSVKFELAFEIENDHIDGSDNNNTLTFKTMVSF